MCTDNEINPEDIYHIYPVDDAKEHVLEVTLNGSNLACNCPCNPRIEPVGGSDGGWIIVHFAFDGRELFEFEKDQLN